VTVKETVGRGEPVDVVAQRVNVALCVRSFEAACWEWQVLRLSTADAGASGAVTARAEPASIPAVIRPANRRRAVVGEFFIIVFLLVVVTARVLM
jgi:hypothetical protein